MKLTIRNDSVEVSGYVNAVGRDSRPLADASGYFIEQVQPGAFARSLSRKDPVMLLNHDPSRVLSTKEDGLDVREDAVGLYARATITDPNVVEKARAGKLSGWSFGFVPIKQDEKKAEDGIRHRTLRDIDLREISLLDDTRTPAYIATSVMTRDDGEEVEVREMPDAVEVRYAAEPAPEPEPADLSAYTQVVEELSARWLS
ncbi:HK97 family phage prohead protease [Collinsella tanakaei]|jgi:HK97 family phage prohead protease|uniref:HK97 family phage prohead protease n=1 Tax=Collinsella tanakaei TaxID=626935 RepID=UPI0022E48172|nr:HK97 family phage prohead protease [Collinsella tanakaei]